jgi:hypothetical protein
LDEIIKRWDNGDYQGVLRFLRILYIFEVSLPFIIIAKPLEGESPIDVVERAVPVLESLMWAAASAEKSQTIVFISK